MTLTYSEQLKCWFAPTIDKLQTQFFMEKGLSNMLRQLQVSFSLTNKDFNILLYQSTYI